MGQGVSLKRNKKYIKLSENENTTHQSFWDTAITEREIYSTKNIHWKRGKVYNQWSKFSAQKPRKRSKEQKSMKQKQDI